ncbi:Uncharacterised protein [Kingella potus]|uniref:Uncharacterized protein n=1 Tax=Kingella potus TaxID=265175 RepID=A0A377R1U1_9NEIS|nr:hypothetical protein [Kingella potus]UOP00706.1 hypothetical protein LVJ84_13070 [Kingella potus]STR02898.1 Uncharacterised protein [Kingella potus]
MRFIFALPVWLMLADMACTFVLNVMQSFASGRKTAPRSDGLPVSPETAFDGLQVLANGGMVLVIGYGLFVLLRLNRTVPRGEAVPLGVAATLGLLAVLSFSLVSVWEWGWALARLAGGEPAVSAANPRYLAAAVCQPLIAFLCLWRLAGWYRIAKRQEKAADVYGAAQ